MYCEKCCRIIDTAPCPVCGGKKVREPEPLDPCFVTELDYVSACMLEDVFGQNDIPFLKKNVLGAGLAIRVGPMLDRSRFYVAWQHLDRARAVVEELFTVLEGEKPEAEAWDETEGPDEPEETDEPEEDPEEN